MGIIYIKQFKDRSFEKFIVLLQNSWKNLSKNSLRILKEKKIISYFIKKDKSKNKELLSVKKKLNMQLKILNKYGIKIL